MAGYGKPLMGSAPMPDVYGSELEETLVNELPDNQYDNYEEKPSALSDFNYLVGDSYEGQRLSLSDDDSKS